MPRARHFSVGGIPHGKASTSRRGGVPARCCASRSRGLPAVLLLWAGEGWWGWGLGADAGRPSTFSPACLQQGGHGSDKLPPAWLPDVPCVLCFDAKAPLLGLKDDVLVCLHFGGLCSLTTQVSEVTGVQRTRPRGERSHTQLLQGPPGSSPAGADRVSCCCQSPAGFLVLFFPRVH